MCKIHCFVILLSLCRHMPGLLAGKGNVNVQLTAGGVPANAVQITVE